MPEDPKNNTMPCFHCKGKGYVGFTSPDHKGFVSSVGCAVCRGYGYLKKVISPSAFAFCNE